MDQCTHEVRAEYWRKIIQACGRRPADNRSNAGWMKTASGSKATTTGNGASDNRLKRK